MLFAGEICAFSSVTDLTEHVSPGAVAPLVYASTSISFILTNHYSTRDSSSEPGTGDLSDIQRCGNASGSSNADACCTRGRRHSSSSDLGEHNGFRVDLVFTRVWLQVKAQPISPMFTCRSTEIITLTDVSDVYNVSTGHDPYEFIIRRSRQGITLYFSSPERDAIVKVSNMPLRRTTETGIPLQTIREAKGKMKESTVSVAERSSRYMNVPASLIHIGMLNVGLGDDELRSAAYDLLCAVCVYLKFNKNPIVASKGSRDYYPPAFNCLLRSSDSWFHPWRS
jgi:hypothetical protein